MNLDDAVIVALGCNLPGDFETPEALLEAALERFADVGLLVTARSRWWRSAAWPDSTLPDYRNGVTIVETALSPPETLAALHGLEAAFGRVRGAPNAARTLDLDLIAHGRATCAEPALTLPHPRAHERLFVMGPLAEIAPRWRHPTLGRTALNLAVSAQVGRDARPI